MVCREGDLLELAITSARLDGMSHLVCDIRRSRGAIWTSASDAWSLSSEAQVFVFESYDVCLHWCGLGGMLSSKSLACVHMIQD